MDQLKITQDQNVLVGDQAAVDNANQAVTNAQQDVATAQAAVTTAQTNLNTANAASTQITAPFDGAITTVNIQAGVGLSVTSSGAIKAGATAIVIADTSKFEANMMVNETDIPNISIGTMATVTATALPNVTLSARVTAISPIATIQSGVVNYAVTATILGVAPHNQTNNNYNHYSFRTIRNNYYSSYYRATEDNYNNCNDIHVQSVRDIRNTSRQLFLSVLEGRHRQVYLLALAT